MPWLVGSTYRGHSLFSMIPTYFLSLSPTSCGEHGVEKDPDSCSAQNTPPSWGSLPGHWQGTSFLLREKKQFCPFTYLATQGYSEFVVCMSAFETCTSDKRTCMLWLSSCLLSRSSVGFPCAYGNWHCSVALGILHEGWMMSLAFSADSGQCCDTHGGRGACLSLCFRQDKVHLWDPGLEVEPTTLHTAGKCSAVELQPSPAVSVLKHIFSHIGSTF